MPAYERSTSAFARIQTTVEDSSGSDEEENGAGSVLADSSSESNDPHSKQQVAGGLGLSVPVGRSFYYSHQRPAHGDSGPYGQSFTAERDDIREGVCVPS